MAIVVFTCVVCIIIVVFTCVVAIMMFDVLSMLMWLRVVLVC